MCRDEWKDERTLCEQNDFVTNIRYNKSGTVRWILSIKTCSKSRVHRSCGIIISSPGHVRKLRMHYRGCNIHTRTREIVVQVKAFCTGRYSKVYPFHLKFNMHYLLISSVVKIVLRTLVTTCKQLYFIHAQVFILQGRCIKMDVLPSSLRSCLITRRL